jgi:hypothetical protein
MVGLSALPGWVPADGVSFLDPESAVFEAMLAGWDRQQRARFLKLETIRARLDLVRRLATVSNQYPRQETCRPAAARRVCSSVSSIEASPTGVGMGLIGS